MPANCLPNSSSLPAPSPWTARPARRPPSLTVSSPPTYLEIDLLTCIGAEILGPTKLDQTDYIVLGLKAGQKKLDEIEEKGLKTINEEEFKEMLGEAPPSKKRKV